MVQRALDLIYKNKNNIETTQTSTHTAYALPQIRDYRGITLGPEVTVNYYPGSKSYVASMIRKVKDTHGNRYVEFYGFKDEDAQTLYASFENPLLYSHFTEGETEALDMAPTDKGN